MKLTKPVKHLLGKSFLDRPEEIAVIFDGHTFKRRELAEALVPYATVGAATRAVRLLHRYHIRSWAQLIAAQISGTARIRGMGEGALWATIIMLELRFGPRIGPQSVRTYLRDNTVSWATARRRAHTRASKHKHPAP
jgi:hypothetical protein